VKATVEGLQSLRRPRDIAELRGKTVREVLGLDGREEEAQPASTETDAEAEAAVAAAPQGE